MFARLDLHKSLIEALGSSNVYYQPPESIKMKYPAIVYNRSAMNTRFANDSLYKNNVAYDVTLIDPNPDSEAVDKIIALPGCRYNRHFIADNLNHDVFTIFSY